MLITRKVEFSASHVCRNPRLSEAENRALYGAAAIEPATTETLLQRALPEH